MWFFVPSSHSWHRKVFYERSVLAKDLSTIPDHDWQSSAGKVEEHVVSYCTYKLPGVVIWQSLDRHRLAWHQRNSVRAGQACIQPDHDQGSSPRRGLWSSFRWREQPDQRRRRCMRPCVENRATVVIDLHRWLNHRLLLDCSFLNRFAVCFCIYSL